MLRGLTVERTDICAAMAFALDNAESGVWGWSGRFECRCLPMKELRCAVCCELRYLLPAFAACVALPGQICALCPNPRPPARSQRGVRDSGGRADAERDAHPPQDCPPLPRLRHPAQHQQRRAQRDALPQVRWVGGAQPALLCPGYNDSNRCQLVLARPSCNGSLAAAAPTVACF